MSKLFHNDRFVLNTVIWVSIGILFQFFVSVWAGTVPGTGQTLCYNNSAVIPCPQEGEPFFGQDANYVNNPPSYTKLDDDGNDLPDSASDWVMVRDNLTGLIWEVKTDDDSVHDKDNTYTWYDSNPETNGGEPGAEGDGTDTEDFLNTLNSAVFGGFSDWRLPTLNELTGLFDHGGPYLPINLDYFPQTASSNYWTSTTYAPIPSSAWIIWPSGEPGGSGKLSSYHVRAVRGGQNNSSLNCVDNSNGTISDWSTGLMWQKYNPGAQFLWQDALAYSENLGLAGYDDWRLPTIKELRSIVDYSRLSPAMNSFYFPETQGKYWSSTSKTSSPNSAWWLNSDSGYTSWGNKLDPMNSKLRVRAVRTIETNSSPQRTALIALYHSTNGQNWTHNTGWKDAPLHSDGFAMPGTECGWYGITCDESDTRIVQLNLSNNNLNGFISGLGGLSDLTLLDLSDNRLSRSIPKELGNLSNLERMILKNNNLSGMIPNELLGLNNLLDSQSDICGNHLFTTDSDLRDFLNIKHIGGVWESCQTPPYTRAITSYSNMPEDSISRVFDDVTFFDYYNNPLSEFGVGVILESSNYGGLSGYWHRNIESSLAPFKDKVFTWNVRFTFAEPVYAFGGTFFATEAVPNPFFDFIKNETNTVTAYDIEGVPVEIVRSSSYSNVVGPVEYHTTLDTLCCGMDNQEFMASYAGFWTDIPIYAVAFSSAEGSAWASVAFSRTPKPAPDRDALPWVLILLLDD